MKQYKFRIPPEMYPGMYREGVGFFKPGEVLFLPDDASRAGDKLHPKLIPLCEEGHAALMEQHKEAPGRKPKGYRAAVIKDVEGQAPEEEPDEPVPMTVKETAEKYAETPVRAADK